MQQKQLRTEVPVRSAELGRTPGMFSVNGCMVMKAEPRVAGVNYAIKFGELREQNKSWISNLSAFDVANDLSGLAVVWLEGHAPEVRMFSGPVEQITTWLPHPDFAAAREFTDGSVMHKAFWRKMELFGTLTLRSQLDLWQMLIPATQPLSKLDYTPEPEAVTVTFKSDAALTLEATGAKVERVSANESRLTVEGARENVWPAFALTVSTPAKSLDVSFSTTRDPRPRALPLRRFLMPFAKPAPPDDLTRTIPEIAGGDWEAGRALFKGKAACATCHQLRGDGVRVGPELGNLVHRDYASVLKDIADPSAMINPDAVGYVVRGKDGTAVTGTRLAETDDELQIAQPGGVVAKLKKTDISKTEPMTVSLMPAGLDKVLTPEELRDLMTYLLTEQPAAAKAGTPAR
jgi:putative heme-binding domain-containing protein